MKPFSIWTTLRKRRTSVFLHVTVVCLLSTCKTNANFSQDNLTACYGLPCRPYNPSPSELNVSGIDSNLFNREEDSCSPNADGFYGMQEGFQQSLDFFYQLETVPLAEGANTVNSEILPKVELEIVDSVLPVVFPDDCGVTARQAQRRRNPRLRRLTEFLGVSSNPPDRVLDEVPCVVAKENETNDCYVTDGSMTLFLASDMDTLSLNKMRNVIQSAMDRGDYNDADPNIVKVSYVRIDQAVDATVQGTGKSNDDGLPNYALALIIIGVVGFVTLIICFVCRREWRGIRRRRELDGQSSLVGGTVE